jgi:hypothetical protein
MAARVSLCDTVSFMWPRTCIPVHSRWLLSHVVTCVVRACVVRKRRSEGCVWVNHVVRSELLGPARDRDKLCEACEPTLGNTSTHTANLFPSSPPQ